MFLLIFELRLGWMVLHQFRPQALLLQERRSRPLHGLRAVAPVPPLWGTREEPQESEICRQFALLALGFQVRAAAQDLELASTPQTSGIADGMHGHIVPHAGSACFF